MSTSVSFNGSSFTVPSTGEESWSGSDKVDGLLISLANNALSKAGGTFTITSEIDFGGTAGLKSLYLKSRGTNVSTTGIVRLANTEAVSWRNAGNSADLALSVDSSNNLTFNGGVVFPASIGAANTVAVSDGSNLTWATITNSNINASAAIVFSKMAALTASRALASDGSGVVSVSTVTTTELQRLSGIGSSAVGISDTQTLTNKTITSFTGNSSSTITTPSATGTLATLAGTEVLTNKDIDGGTASNAKRITFPKDTLANITALTRKEGTVWYATDTDKLYKDDGTSLTEIGSGSGGSINYITNPDAESGTTGWATYADAAATNPVDGTGGSPTLTITRTTTSPLRGTGSFLITKDAANRQGEGVSYAFSVDSADKAKVLNISFDYEIASGTFVSGDSSDLRVWIYDVTNSALIPVSPYTIQGGGSNQWTFKGVFQTASNSTSYRLIIHVATTSASAWGFEFDNVVVGPQVQLLGSPVNDWTAYTPSWVGLGTVASTTGFYRRVGDSIEVKFFVEAGTVTGSTLTMSLPSGLSIDSVKVGGNNKWLLGNSTNSNAGGGSGVFIVSVGAAIVYDSSDATKVFFAPLNAADSTSNTFGNPAAASSVVNTSGQISGTFIAPISGWSSTVLMSNDTDTRVVAARLSGDPASASAGNPIIFPTTDFDTHGAYNASTGRYTVPVSGIYDVCGMIGNGSTTRGLNLYVDAVISIALGNATGSANSAYIGQAKLNAGQVIDIRPDGTLDAQSNSTLIISRRSGPSAIAATETVACRYSSSTGTTLTKSANNTVPFAVKDYDTHGAFVTDTFTCPIAGKYRVSSNILLSSGATWAAADALIIEALKNSTANSGTVVYQQASHTSNVSGLLTATVNCLAGDTLKINVNPSKASAGNVTLNGTATYNWVAIERIGN